MGAFENEHIHKQSLKLEVFWAAKAKKGRSEADTRTQAGESSTDESSAPGVIYKIRSAASRSMSWIQHEIDEHTGASVEEWKKLDSELELKTTWTPFELNPNVARLYRPELNISEHVTVMLFVGIDTCYNLPHQTALPDTKFWAEVECLPFIDENDDDIIESRSDSRQK